MVFFILTFLIACAAGGRASDRGKSVADAVVPTVVVGVLLSLLACVVVSTAWAGQERTITKIVTPIERGVINNEPVFTFTTADNKMWAVPTDTYSEIGYTDSLVFNEYTSPQWLWSVFPAFTPDYKSLLIAP